MMILAWCFVLFSCDALHSVRSIENRANLQVAQPAEIVPHTCEEDLSVFLTRLKDLRTSIRGAIPEPRDTLKLIDLLKRCIHAAKWTWDGVASVLNWVEELYKGEFNDGANEILIALEKSTSCEMIGSVIANVQWAPAASLKWTHQFRAHVLETFIRAVPWCVQEYTEWTVNEILAILDWTAKNPGKLSDDIFNKLVYLRMRPAYAVELAKGVMEQKYSSRLDWEAKFNIRVQVSLVHTLWNACLEEEIDFDQFMRLLRAAEKNPKDENIAIVLGMSANIVGGRWAVPKLFQLMEWARSNQSSLVSIIREAFQQSRDCPKSLEVIVGTYSKSYAEAESWDEAYSNQVLDAVVPVALVCVSAGSYSIDEIMNWFHTARKNPGAGAFEVAESFRTFPRCDELVTFFADLHTQKLHEISKWKSLLRSAVLKNVALGLTGCLKNPSAAVTILKWLHNSSAEGKSLWDTIKETNDCSLFSQIQKLVETNFGKAAHFSRVGKFLSGALAQC